MLGCRPRAIVAAEPPLLVASSSLRGCDEACLMRSCLTWRPASWPASCLAGGSIPQSRRMQAGWCGRVERGEPGEVLRAVRLSMRGSRAMLPMVQFGRSLRP